MYNGPFTHFNQFSPFTPNFVPSFLSSFGGFNGGFGTQATPFAFFQGSPQAFCNGGTWFGATNGVQGQGSSFPGQFGGQGTYAPTPTGWNPVVTQTSDGFTSNASQFNGFAANPAQAGGTFTPYSYQQPFFPGFQGPTGNEQAFQQGFNGAGTSNFTGAAPFSSNVGGPTFPQPGAWTNAAWYPTNTWPGTPAFTPTWGPSAWNPGAGYQVNGTFNPYAPNLYATNAYPTNGFQGYSGAPTAGFVSPAFHAGTPANVGYPTAGFPTPGFSTTGQGFGQVPSVYNGYNTFPFISNAAPGFPSWNQTGPGVSFYGNPTGPFLGSFHPGTSAQGWFPGQATFPWYSQVNGSPGSSSTGQVNLRPVDSSDASATAQAPRGIQFNRDAA